MEVSFQIKRMYTSISIVYVWIEKKIAMKVRAWVQYSRRITEQVAVI